MSDLELEKFEAELRNLKPARPAEELVVRLEAELQARHGSGLTVPERAAPVEPRRGKFAWMARGRLLGGWFRFQAEGTRLLSARIFWWLAPVGCALIIGAVLMLRNEGVHSGQPGQATELSARSTAAGDNVEIDRQLVAAFDAVARLPDGEPVRFRCHEWVEAVVWRDPAGGVEVESQAPHLEIVPVGLETF